MRWPARFHTPCHTVSGPGAMRGPAGSWSLTPPCGEEPLVLRATYWGGERDRVFHIEVDGRRIATQRLQGEHPGEFIERDYCLPLDLVQGKDRVRIRFQPETGHTAGPVFGCRVLATESGA